MSKTEIKYPGRFEGKKLEIQWEVYDENGRREPGQI